MSLDRQLITDGLGPHDRVPPPRLAATPGQLQAGGSRQPIMGCRQEASEAPLKRPDAVDRVFAPHTVNTTTLKAARSVTAGHVVVAEDHYR